MFGVNSWWSAMHIRTVNVFFFKIIIEDLKSIDDIDVSYIYH